MFKSEKGVSAVEFALIAPLLFILTFGIIEFSVLLFDKAVVTNASREGARAAVVYNEIFVNGASEYAHVSTEKIREVVNNYTENYLISLGGEIPLAIEEPEYEPAVPTPGGYVTIRVNYTYNFLVFQSLLNLIGVSTFDQGLLLQGTTRMRMEGGGVI